MYFFEIKVNDIYDNAIMKINDKNNILFFTEVLDFFLFINFISLILLINSCYYLLLNIFYLSMILIVYY